MDKYDGVDLDLCTHVLSFINLALDSPETAVNAALCKRFTETLLDKGKTVGKIGTDKIVLEPSMSMAPDLKGRNTLGESKLRCKHSKCPEVPRPHLCYIMFFTSSYKVKYLVYCWSNPGLLRYAAELDTVGDSVISSNLDNIRGNVRKLLAPPKSALKAPPAAPAAPPKSPAPQPRPAAPPPPPPPGGKILYLDYLTFIFLLISIPYKYNCWPHCCRCG